MKRIASIFMCTIFAAALATAAFADGAELYGSCKGCHGPDGAKAALNVSPPLKGQSAETLLTKMQGYKDGTYSIQDKTAPMMKKILMKMNDEELKTLADYIAAF